MAFELFIPYRSNGNDASLDIISRFARILRKGFVNAWQDSTQNVVSESIAPLIVPRSGSLNVDVTPGSGIGWMALSNDGMVIREQTSTHGPLTVAASTKNYIVLRALYAPSTGGEVVEFQSLTEADYNASPVKSQLIIVGTLTLGATSDASTGTVSYDERDRVEGFFDTPWRPSVDTFANLPTSSNDILKTGDTVIVRDSFTMYVWNGSAWVTAGGAASLHVAAGITDAYRVDQDRAVQGSGILAGGLDSSQPFARLPGLQVHSMAAARTIGLGEMRLIINGFGFKTKHIDYQMTAPPGVGTRYDLLYLEMYRMEVASPSAVTFDNYTGSSVSLGTVITAMESLSAKSDETGASIDFGPIERTADNKYLITVYSIREESDLSASTVADPYDLATYSVAPTNSDGNTWSYGANSYDDRVWYATHSSAYGTHSYGMPLVMIKRDSSESLGVLTSLSGENLIFPIHPVCDTGGYIRGLLEGLSNARSSSQDARLPSGVKETTPWNGPSSGYSGGMKLSIAGYNLEVTEATTRPISTPSAPTTGARRDLVYATLNLVAFTDPAGTGRQIIPLGEFREVPYSSTYMKEVYAQVEFHMEGVGQVEDVDDAFAALGYSRIPGDPGLFGIADVSFDPRLNFDQVTYAIPIAVVERRNTGTWDASTNPNGGASRPDSLTTSIVNKDITSWSHLVGLDRHDIEQLLHRSTDSLLRGDLPTNIVRHPTHSGVAGRRFLMTEAIGVTSAGYRELPAAPDGFRTAWSDAVELRPFGTSFLVHTGSFSGPIFSYDSGTGQLDIVMPTGMSIYITATDPTAFHFVGYESAGPPSLPKVSTAGWNTVGSESGAVTGISGFTINNTDSFGYPTDVTCTLTFTGTGLVRFFFWAIMQRSDTDVQHQDNGGLLLPPDDIIQIETGGGFTTPISTTPLVASLEATLSGDTATFDLANLTAAIDTPGTPTYLGVMAASVENVSRSGYSYTATINDAQTEAVVTLSTAAHTGETCRIMVAYETSTVTQWLEFSRSAKSVIGPFQWSEYTWTDQTTARKVMGVPQAKSQGMMGGCLMWRTTSTSNDWEISNSPEFNRWQIDEGSAQIELRDISGAALNTGIDLKAVFVTLEPFEAADEIRIYYEATPYMGISGLQSAASKRAAIVDRLQGEVLLPGKVFVTSGGYAPYYVFPTDVSEAAPARSGYDQDFMSNHPNRALAFIQAGSGFRRYRDPNVPDVTNEEVGNYSMVMHIPKNGMDALPERLPWPDYANMSVTVNTSTDWEAGTVEAWELTYEPFTAANNGNIGGGYFYWCDDRNIAEEISGRRPTPGLEIGYGDLTNAQKNSLESVFMVDGDRGVATTMLAYDLTNTTADTFISTGVAFLAPGSVEGLLTSEMDQGHIGYLIPQTLPTFLSVGTGFRISGSGTTVNYYGGHSTFIRATTGTQEGVIHMQVSGSPRKVSQAPPAGPYAVQVGGVYDAFWPLYRPLLPVRKV